MQRPRAVTPTRYRDTKRRVARRLRTETQAAPWSGRWSLVYRAGVLGPPLTDEERAHKLARLLLSRYGVVTRECLEHEGDIGNWGFLYPQFQRMELRGELRRGYFVAGLGGVQFALPEAVEQLRQPSENDEPIVLNATDPANVFGGELSDVPLRFARLPATHVVLVRGQPILVAEDNGERISTLRGSAPELIHHSVQAYLTRPQKPRHIVVSQWNGESVLGSEGQALLETLAFYRAPSGMEWWASR